MTVPSVLLKAIERGSKLMNKKPKVYGDPKLGDIRALRKQSNLHLQRNPDVSKSWVKGDFDKVASATAENTGSSALGAGTMVGGAGAYGIYNMIQNWINSGELDEDFEEADLERLMMEAGYDADALDDQGEIYEGDNEDEMFLRSYVRGGQTGLRNEQGDFMTAQEAKDELEKLYGKK